MVIRLPGNDGDAGIGAITTPGGADPVVIADVDAINSLLEAYLQDE